MSIPTLDSINAARRRISGAVHVTPMFTSRILGELSGTDRLSLKCESFQKTGSFKVRGALNAILQLDEEARARGVVTVSAGNHAQAVAWAAASIGVKSTVVMPATASPTKAAASREYGAEVILHGTGADAFALAHKLADERVLTFVHPFDNLDVLAGAGTTGLEILEQAPDTDVVVVPIGGGGLIGGIAAAIKQVNPAVRIYGVEPVGAAAMRMSLDAGHAVKIDSVSTIADGLAAPFAGELCYGIVRDLVEDVVLVSDGEIAEAMQMLLTRAKILAEPAGAAATAALLSGKIPEARGARIVSIVSGGNVDLDRLRGLI